MLVFDLVVFCMTFYKILTLPRSTNTGVLTVFKRDGERRITGLASTKHSLNVLHLIGLIYFGYAQFIGLDEYFNVAPLY